MAIEYRLQFAAPDVAAVADVLRRHPESRNGDPLDVRFEYGSAEGDWPQATARVETGGAYFCDHCGGSGRAILGELVARPVSAFGPVTVEEL